MAGSLDYDWHLRLSAFAQLELLRRHSGVITARALDAGFEFRGERIRFWSARRGIWRPRQLRDSGAALTIVTTPERPGRERPYDDQVASDHGWFIYKYEGTDPDHWTNAAVRAAMIQGRPLIYLYGICPGIYEPIFPAFVVGDEPANLEFRIAADTAEIPEPLDERPLEARRAYATTMVKQRLHQHKFRQLVVSAYRTSCAVCRIRHAELLDAAHILPDRDLRGRPEVPNGLSLCKIHHAAYDADILGVDPDCVVHVRRDVLDEHDGPMLRHGLQAMQGVRLQLPRRPKDRPNPDYLDLRFARFRAA